MEKLVRIKVKKPKKASTKTSRKRKTEIDNDGPTCSGFLSELSRKWAFKKRQEAEAPRNIVQTIIDSITNALPIKIIKRPPKKREEPVVMETLQTYAPELISKDTYIVPVNHLQHQVESENFAEQIPVDKSSSEMLPPHGVPRMPVADSEVFKGPPEKRRKTTEAAVNTGGDTDVATELVKHVGTLKKISLIAEEFNKKTAQNLKEIVASVQEDLMKKLAEIKEEQKRMTPSPATNASSIDQEIVQKT